MIIKNFNIEEFALDYSIGISQIEINYPSLVKVTNGSNQKDLLDQIINDIDQIQEKYESTVIQILNDKNILNQEHIFAASYYMMRAFHKKINISNKRNIELLLYLATERQIKNAIEKFGITLEHLNEGILTFTFITHSNDINKILQEVMDYFNGKEVHLNINEKNLKKLNRIRRLFNINDNQLEVTSAFYKNDEDDELNRSFLAVHDLICENMAKLSLEK